MQRSLSSRRRPHVAAILSLALFACGGGTTGPVTPECIVHNQCALGQCIAGKCLNATPCGDDNNCVRGTRCVAQRCIPVCGTDLDCPAAYVCTPDGCTEFSDKTPAPPPVDAAAAKVALKAGVSEKFLDVPVGVSLGGFAGRGGLYNDEYAEAIFPSTGFYQKLKVKALALDTGNARVVLLASPLIFITDYLRERVVRILKRDTGKDYREHLILTANHTHSGPARFWTLPRGFGSFGLDEHMPEIHERIARSMADAIVDAVAKLAPAKMGWHLETAFDPENKITSSRRRPSANGKDRRLFMMRVDDEAGQPIAAVVTLAIHGIMSEGEHLSADAGGGIEFKLEEALEAKHNRRVPVLHVQGNGGNISPRCDDTHLPEVPRAELCGIRTVPYVLASWDTMTRKSDWDMRFATKRVPISRTHIGYTENEFYDENPIGGYKPFVYGAFSCVVFSDESMLPARDGNIGCVLPIESTFRAPVQTFSKAALGMLKLDDLLISTQPGEPVMEYGHRVVTGLKRNAGVREAVTFGLANDHHLYLIGADEWFYGGVEGNTTVWGFKFGDYLEKESIAFGADFWAGKKIESKVLPQDFFISNAPPDIVPTTTPVAEVGVMVSRTPEAIERVQQLKVTVVGGHPGAGSPDVVLQRGAGGGAFADLANDGQPHTMGKTRYDNAGYKFITDHELVAGKHHWSVRWEELRTFPTGQYRFRFALPYWNGTAKLVKEAFSPAFQLLASSTLELTGLSVDAGGVSVIPVSGPGIQDLAERERFQRGVQVDLDCDGVNDVTMDYTHDWAATGIRMRDPDLTAVDPQRLEGNVKITVTKSGSTAQVFENVAPGTDNTAARTMVKVGRGPVTASTTRPELVGETLDGIRCLTFRAPAYAVTTGFTFGGAGSYLVRVEDTHGNFGEKTIVVP